MINKADFHISNEIEAWIINHVKIVRLTNYNKLDFFFLQYHSQPQSRKVALKHKMFYKFRIFFFFCLFLHQLSQYNSFGSGELASVFFLLLFSGKWMQALFGAAQRLVTLHRINQNTPNLKTFPILTIFNQFFFKILHCRRYFGWLILHK